MNKIFSERDILKNLVNVTSGRYCDRLMSLEDTRVLYRQEADVGSGNRCYNCLL